jgi:hypothetical protein
MEMAKLVRMGSWYSEEGNCSFLKMLRKAIWKSYDRPEISNYKNK